MASTAPHNAPLAGVACPTTSPCTAVGNYASASANANGNGNGNGNGDFLPWAERWDDRSWSVQPAASPAGAFYSQFLGVACPTTLTCIAVGDSTRYNTQTNTRRRPVALAERVSG